ncbi:hypothetical protein [Schlesneria sp. DSM 10557]
MTIEEVEASLAQQVERHRILKLIVEELKKLEDDDPDGVEWIMEKLNDE